jgi:hypothetical protein
MASLVNTSVWNSLDIVVGTAGSLINFKCIFQKLVCSEPQGQGMTLADGQVPCNMV